MKFILFAILLIAFIWASNDDYKHEVMEEQAYINNVCMGYWPDYKDLNPSCEVKE